ncbi:hypothetical protein GCM10022221_68690 [Actinocorallia aurea]
MVDLDLEADALLLGDLPGRRAGLDREPPGVDLGLDAGAHVRQLGVDAPLQAGAQAGDVSLDIEPDPASVHLVSHAIPR